jgi:hypothetical protein
MNVQEQIQAYIASQPAAKRSDIQELHKLILRVSPKCKLWFLDGKDSKGKTISNPNIGYGSFIMQYADGTTKESFQQSISANTSGISLYIIGVKDKTYLSQAFAENLGKATITGYCIKFKSLKDINMAVLEEIISYGFKAQVS